MQNPSETVSSPCPSLRSLAQAYVAALEEAALAREAQERVIEAAVRAGYSFEQLRAAGVALVTPCINDPFSPPVTWKN